MHEGGYENGRGHRAQGQIMSADDRFTGTREVDPRHAPDEARLTRWLEQNVEGFEGPLSLRQFRGGQSNPTFEVTATSGTYVLRRKPPGPLLPSAHAVDREHRVISALWSAGFPVPRPYGLCTDDSVIGSMFYVMEKVEGRILWNLSLPDQSPEQRRAIYLSQIDTLAHLHRLDPGALGLADFGREGNYFARQVTRWTRQYQASETETIREMDRLMAWLPEGLPPERPARIVHGDFRLDNLVLSHSGPQVRAVLDWELSTLGDPMADFSYFLIAWAIPASERNGIGGLDLEALGIPSLDEAVEHYAGATGGSRPDNLDWLMAYNLFRLAAICQGIAGRVRDGTAASAHALSMAERVRPLAEAAMSFAVRAGA